MANIKISDIPVNIDTVEEGDTLLTLQQTGGATKMTQVGSVTGYVNSNFRLDNKQYDALTYYVDLDVGNDNNSGVGPGVALATIQEAVNRHFPSWKGPKDLGTTPRYIIVSGVTNTTITESVVIPPFVGDGPLVISGVQDTVYANAVETGAVFSPVASYASLQDLSFAGPFTPSDPALANKAFVVPKVTTYATLQEANIDCFPILDNGGASIRCPVYLPGVFSGFDHYNGAVCDLKVNRLTWRPDINIDQSFPAYVNGGFCISNNGGPLIVQNFDFEENPSQTLISNGTVVLYNNSPANGAGTLYNQTQVARCRVIGNISIASGEGVDVVSCIATGGGIFTFDQSYSFCLNLIATPTSPGSYPTNVRGRTVIIGGLYNAAYLQLFQSYAYADAVDMRFRGIVVNENSRLDLGDTTWENVTAAPCIQVSFHSSIRGTPGATWSGSTGNTSYGATISTMSLIKKNTATITVSGTSGELVVGQNPPQLWAAGGAVDNTFELCAYIV